MESHQNDNCGAAMSHVQINEGARFIDEQENLFSSKQNQFQFQTVKLTTDHVYNVCE